MHNGLISSLSSYPMNYLNDPFLPYDSFLDITILLISTLLISSSFLFLLNVLFIDVFITKNWILLAHCYTKSLSIIMPKPTLNWIDKNAINGNNI